MARRTIAVFAALAALAAAPAFAEDPFVTSERLCSGDYPVSCSKVLTAEAVGRTPTIGAFLKLSGWTIEELRYKNGWGDDITPDTQFRPGVRIVLWITEYGYKITAAN